jgi:hypothetical protein
LFTMRLDSLLSCLWRSSILKRRIRNNVWSSTIHW